MVEQQEETPLKAEIDATELVENEQADPLKAVDSSSHSILCPNCGTQIPDNCTPTPTLIDDKSVDSRLKETPSDAAARNATLTVYGTAPPYEVLTPVARNLILASLLIARFLIVLDTTIVAVALPSILADLGEPNYLSWLVASYLLTSCSFQPLTGRLSDVLGRRMLYLSSLVLFLICSALCGAATSFWFLCIARVLQGIGGGTLAALTLVVGGDISAPKDRPKVLGLLGSTATFGAICGPLVGGALTVWVGWRAIFYVNVPICVICFVIAFIGMKKMEIPNVRLPLDWLGSLLALSACVCFVLFVTWGGNNEVGYAWDSPLIVCLIWATGVLALIFVLVEERHPLPILPLRLFKIRNFSVCCALIFCTFMIMTTNTYYIAFFFQEVQGNSPIISGCKVLAFSLGFFIGLVMARKFTTSKYIMVLMGCSGLLILVGTILMTTLAHGDVNFGFIFIAIFPMGTGIGFQIPTSGALTQLAVAQKDIAVAMSAYSFSSLLGGTVGITVAGAVFNYGLEAGLDLHLPLTEAKNRGITSVYIYTCCSAALTAIIGFFAVPAVIPKGKANAPPTVVVD